MVFGGATGRIGDPSGRRDDRPELSDTVITANLDSISTNVKQIFVNAKLLDQAEQTHDSKHEEVEVLFLDNYSWYKNVDVLSFVSSIGRHFRVNSMLAKESVKARLESVAGMSFLEFTYQLFQAYDFLHLFRTHRCILQIGGSDQWGNITAGTELIRKVTGEQTYGLTLPLITTASGEKLGKSAGNAVWLNKQLTSPYQLYQYFLQTDDRDVGRYLRLFTFLPLQQIDHALQQHDLAKENRTAQALLAANVRFNTRTVELST